AHILDHPAVRRALDARLELRSDLAEHRLERENHSLAQLETPAPLAVVVDLRFLVHLAAGPMPDEVANDMKPARLGMLLTGSPDVPEMTARPHLFDREIETFL